MGALQGPAELLPVSSSGHLALLPRLLGWHYSDLPSDARKTFEVACHAGSVPVVVAAARRLHRRAGERPDLAALPLAVLPTGVAGLAFERPIEAGLGGPRSVAAAQIGAGLALALADRRGGERERSGPADHLAVGVAQAVALVPGVSRLGAALTAARMRGLSRRASLRLALAAAAPVTLGAAALKAARAAGGKLDRDLHAAALAGGGAALLSTAAAYPLLARLERTPSYAPLAAYRIGFGVLALAAAGSEWARPPCLNGADGRRRVRARRRRPVRLGLGRVRPRRGPRRHPDPA
ncbi:MAG TPA: undecaprenyl-diphosphate phosphatase [Thermoleophilaceae bacterium]|nr:undecaprenyl-diphosphate phosphatase [Thermoleophilaceae bacterium]